VVNIDKIFHKKLYKLEGETDKLFYDSLGLRVGLKKEINGNSDMPFSLESINDMITFYLSVNEKYVNGEEYMSLFKEREKRLEEIKKSSEYARLGNQKDEPETEEEEDEFDDIDIPKPMFFNSKLEEKNKEKEKVNNNNNSNENKNNENNNENQKYNDINYWHIELKDDNMNNIMKELLL
jgi:hypothetical protein